MRRLWRLPKLGIKPPRVFLGATSRIDPMQEDMREWLHAARLAVNGSLPGRCINARLVNGRAPELFPVCLSLKSRLVRAKAGAPRPRCDGK
jgi:hypothetical protein